MVREERQAWFALQVRPRFECSVAEVLEKKDVHVYVPQYVELRQWSDRIKAAQSPLFPGYVFCLMDTSQRKAVLSTANAIRLVGAGRTPLPLDEKEMHAVRLIVDSGLPKAPWQALKKGDRVRICDGPLTGVSGILQSTPEGPRLIVSLTLLNRSIAVTVDRNWVIAADAA